MLNSGERQVAPTVDGVRADHRARYEWAAKQMRPGRYVLDYGCGIGYGARILAEAGHMVVAVDDDEETIAYAEQHYGHPNIRFVVEKQVTPEVCRWPTDDAMQAVRFDAAVAFEVIEHVADPRRLLVSLQRNARSLFASVPNEAVLPFKSERNGFKGYAFHHRHYTRAEFEELLRQTGWEPAEWRGQSGPESPVTDEENGRTIIVQAERGSPSAFVLSCLDEAPMTAPEAESLGHVVILGLGPSLEQYLDLTKRLGSRKAFADQVWAINALGDIVQCDLVFHMDDVRVQELRAAAAPKSNIARMVEWLKAHPGPVMTSRAHPSYPGLVEFPLAEVINDLGYAYFNGTAAYAAAYAIFKGASKISFFGCDYSYEKSHHAEKGRACLEFWLGVAAARGIELGFADQTSLMDTCDDPHDTTEIRPYGYDFDRVRINVTGNVARVTFEPRKTPPTAAEIEARYDHQRPTTPAQLLAKSTGDPTCA